MLPVFPTGDDACGDKRLFGVIELRAVGKLGIVDHLFTAVRIADPVDARRRGYQIRLTRAPASRMTSIWSSPRKPHRPYESGGTLGSYERRRQPEFIKGVPEVGVFDAVGRINSRKTMGRTLRYPGRAEPPACRRASPCRLRSYPHVLMEAVSRFPGSYLPALLQAQGPQVSRFDDFIFRPRRHHPHDVAGQRTVNTRR